MHLKCDARASLAAQKDTSGAELNLAAAGSLNKVLEKVNQSALPDFATPASMKEQVIEKIETSEGPEAHFSTNAASMGFTSSSMPIQSKNVSYKYDALESLFLAMESIVDKKDKAGKALVDITTNYGIMSFELYVSKCPRTCYNFIELAKKGTLLSFYFLLISGRILQQ